MLLLEFSMFPVGKGESLSKYVARTLDIIDKSGVIYRLGPIGTVLEGEWDEVFRVIKKCFEKMRRNSNRISTTIKIDYRKGRESRINSKIKKVEKILGRKLNK